MFYLVLDAKPVADDEQGSFFSNPSSICLEIVDQFGKVERPVLNAKWDLAILLNWFLGNKGSILEESFPFSRNANESIASAIQRFYDEVDPDNDRELDAMYSYRERHGLRLALRGLDAPDVYLGLTKPGIHEISCAENDMVWNFEVDLLAFFGGTALKNLVLKIEG